MAIPQNTVSQDVVPDRFPMSWEQYWALDESVPGEYFDDNLVVSPHADYQHQLISHRLWNALSAVLPPEYRVSAEWNWSPATGTNFIPDVMVHTVPTDLVRFSGIPVLVVEVLSGNRSHDLLVKRARYAAFGLENYWIVDRDAGILQALQLEGESYREVARIGDEPAEIEFGIARVTLSVAQLLTY